MQVSEKGVYQDPLRTNVEIHIFLWAKVRMRDSKTQETCVHQNAEQASKRHLNLKGLSSWYEKLGMYKLTTEVTSRV